MKLQEAINLLDNTFKGPYPDEAMNTILENYDEARPLLFQAIKDIKDNPKLSETHNFYIFALHLLAQQRESEAFDMVIDLVCLDDDNLDLVLGDITTETLPNILYGLFDNDINKLKNLITNVEINQYVRGSLMILLNRLYLDEVIDKESFKDFLKAIIHDKDDLSEVILSKVSYAIKTFRFFDMIDELKYMYTNGILYENYSSVIDVLFDYNIEIIKKPVIIDAKALLTKFIFDAPKVGSYTDTSLIILKRKPVVNKVIKKEKICRNDPCPCGSGKKYKKCCMNKPDKTVESFYLQKEILATYPQGRGNDKSDKIYIDDYYDQDCLEMDRLLYLAYQRGGFFNPRLNLSSETKLQYLKQAFNLFIDKMHKENIDTVEEFDRKYAVHYFVFNWFNDLLKLTDDDDEYQKIKEETKFIKDIEF